MAGGMNTQPVAFEFDLTSLRRGIEARNALKERAAKRAAERGGEPAPITPEQMDNIALRQQDKGRLLNMYV